MTEDSKTKKNWGGEQKEKQELDKEKGEQNESIAATLVAFRTAHIQRATRTVPNSSGQSCALIR
jgi:hypothetical protein